MKSKKNIKVGINNLFFFLLLLLFTIFISGVLAIEKSELLEGKFVDIKILDKVSSKNKLLKIEIGKEKKLPIYILIDGCKKKEFKAYASLFRYSDKKLVEKKCQESLDKGFKIINFWCSYFHISF